MAKSTQTTTKPVVKQAATKPQSNSRPPATKAVSSPKGTAIATVTKPALVHPPKPPSLVKAARLPSSSMQEKMQRDAGRGVSSKADDNIVPMMYILQANSPQCSKRNPAYIEGAEGGSIWLRNCSEPIIPGENGFDFQPCYFYRNVVEWVPRSDGGGFAGTHEEMPDSAEQQEIQTDSGIMKVMVLPNGNHCVDTRYHVGWVHGVSSRPLPYVMPLKSTGHTFSKNWMFAMNQNTTDANDIAPSWSCMWTIRTEPKTNKKGDWFQYSFERVPGWVDEETYDRGEALASAFERNTKRAEDQVNTDRSGTTGSSGDM